MTNTPKNIYNRSFFEGQMDQSLESARELVPRLIEWFKPTSVVDVGCGVGTWLSVFHANGVADGEGIDGDYVNRDMLSIPASHFTPRDLRNPGTFSRRFDLVISLETAEHLPEESAGRFVKFLTSLGNVVLFSAAIPGQARTPGVHLNEQWPDYWVALFADCGYRVIDCVRPRIWQNERVCWWYAQNALLFIEEEDYHKYAHLQHSESGNNGRNCALSIVHPKLFRQYADFESMSVRRKIWVFKRLVKSMGRKIAGKLPGAK